MPSFLRKVKKFKFSPVAAAITLTISAFLYVFMEWLFVISKPSFLNNAAWGEKLLVLLHGATLLACAALVVGSPFLILHNLARSKTLKTILAWAATALGALLFAATILLFIDNFTYNLFQFGVVSTKGVIRALYLAGFLLLVAGLTLPTFSLIHQIERSHRGASPRVRCWLPVGLGLFLAISAALPFAQHALTSEKTATVSTSGATSELPNILLITADGLNAAKLSVYESKQDTTPFLRSVANEFLVAENAYSNAQGTVGSITSILTGKFPADTRVLTVEDILRGEDATQHLPGILRDHGYTTVQLSFSYYGDAYRVNFQGAFDEANGESPIKSKLEAWLADRLPTNPYYFLRELITRITDRVGHIFFIKDMTNAFLQVTEAEEKFNDQQKLDYLFKLLETSEKPVFVDIHWMGTHGPRYYPTDQVFSKGEDPKIQGKYEDIFYLDAILEFDRGIEQVYTFLDEKGFLEETLLVVGTDHTQRWSVARVPLMMRFPNQEFAGSIRENAQNMDIAPTLLDYLDIAQPRWMPGQSLLEPIDPYRPIFLTAIPDSTRDPLTNKVVFSVKDPPFYQFGKVSVIVCDQYYALNIRKEKFVQAEVAGHSGECALPPLSKADALALIIEHMQNFGFETESLHKILP